MSKIFDADYAIGRCLGLIDKEGGYHSSMLDDLVHDLASRIATSVNNGGTYDQVRFIVNELGPGAEAEIAQIIKDRGGNAL